MQEMKQFVITDPVILAALKKIYGADAQHRICYSQTYRFLIRQVKETSDWGHGFIGLTMWYHYWSPYFSDWELIYDGENDVTYGTIGNSCKRK